MVVESLNLQPQYTQDKNENLGFSFQGVLGFLEGVCCMRFVLGIWVATSSYNISLYRKRTVELFVLIERENGRRKVHLSGAGQTMHFIFLKLQ